MKNTEKAKGNVRNSCLHTTREVRAQITTYRVTKSKLVRFLNSLKLGTEKILEPPLTPSVLLRTSQSLSLLPPRKHPPQTEAMKKYCLVLLMSLVCVIRLCLAWLCGIDGGGGGGGKEIPKCVVVFAMRSVGCCQAPRSSAHTSPEGDPGLI